jgi:hypothetical protein
MDLEHLYRDIGVNVLADLPGLEALPDVAELARDRLLILAHLIEDHIPVPKLESRTKGTNDE